jgi:hypothetical protein
VGRLTFVLKMVPHTRSLRVMDRSFMIPIPISSEPEISTHNAQAAADFYNNSLGSGQETGMMFPYFHTQTIHDGLVSEGESEVVMLTRSAWAGMQRWGAALWSGDTSSHWDSLKVSIPAGLNTQLSGIAWWTTGALRACTNVRVSVDSESYPSRCVHLYDAVFLQILVDTLGVTQAIRPFAS